MVSQLVTIISYAGVKSINLLGLRGRKRTEFFLVHTEGEEQRAWVRAEGDEQ